VNAIDRRLQQLALFDQATAYSKRKKKKHSLQKELENFISSLPRCLTLATVTPRDICRFLVHNDKNGKTQVHRNGCPHLRKRGAYDCACLLRLSFKTVDSYIGKLRAIFHASGRERNVLFWLVIRLTFQDIFFAQHSRRGHTWCALRLIRSWGSFERIPAGDGIGQCTNSSWFQGWVRYNPCFVMSWAVRVNGSCSLDTTTYGPSLFTTGHGPQSGGCFDKIVCSRHFSSHLGVEWIDDLERFVCAFPSDTSGKRAFVD